MKKTYLFAGCLAFVFSLMVPALPVHAEILSGNIPYCDAIGTRSEGWYQDSGFIAYDYCDGCTAYCDFIGTRAEGWYSDCGEKLVLYAFCTEESGTYEQYPLGSFFPDTEGHFFESAIEFVYLRGYVEGYSDGSFRPDSTINRAEFTKIIVNALNLPLDDAESCFTDVNYEWFSSYVCAAKRSGIIDGYPDGSFKPGSPVNFVEALKIILNGYDSNITGYGDGSAWYSGYLSYARENFLSFAADTEPNDLLTRGQMAEIIYWIDDPYAHCYGSHCAQYEDCSDGFDNDGDVFIDCDDDDCYFENECAALDAGEICDDGVDNEGDGLIDCVDYECESDPWCAPGEICYDGLDNDNDQYVDCEDLDCEYDILCGTPEDCEDTIDNDNDGLIDCGDPDCDALCGLML